MLHLPHVYSASRIKNSKYLPFCILNHKSSCMCLNTKHLYHCTFIQLPNQTILLQQFLLNISFLQMSLIKIHALLNIVRHIMHSGNDSDMMLFAISPSPTLKSLSLWLLYLQGGSRPSPATHAQTLPPTVTVISTHAHTTSPWPPIFPQILRELWCAIRTAAAHITAWTLQVTI